MTDTYKSFWNAKASDLKNALIAVDGSADETIAQLTGAQAAKRVHAALNLQSNDRVFELGCGVARIGRELAPQIAHWHGLDISENMLQVAGQRLAGISNVSLQPLHNWQLPLADASVDKGYCIAVFIHMDKEDVALYLRDVARALRPGGTFYFDHWNLNHPVGYRRFELELAAHSRLAPGECRDVARNQFATAQELTAYADAAGLSMLFIDNAHFIQCVVRKPTDQNDNSAQEITRLESLRETIAYSPCWIAQFDAMLDDAASDAPPHTTLKRLAADEKTDPVATQLHRRWLRGIWIQHVERWGPVPDELMMD